jgi:uncharacterized protein YjbI with pentapeptide repeats
MAVRDYGVKYSFENGARCDVDQRRMLMRCSRAKDPTEWNNWRSAHLDEQVWLCGIDLPKANLARANLAGAHLEGSVLAAADLERSILSDACLDGCVLWQANMRAARMWRVRFVGATLWRARLQRSQLPYARLDNATLRETDLRDTDLSNAHLEGSVLEQARLEGARLNDTQLHDANLQFALIDAGTRLSGCGVNRNTDFTGVGLDAGRVEPGLRQLLDYNVRRKRWREWYHKGTLGTRIVKRLVIAPFWWMSDYGIATSRILLTFAFLALAFAGIYYWRPEWLEGLNSDHGPLSALHALYFSLVTMTTLGFGDIHARPDVWQGQVLLMIQVTLGYVLLGALVTRLAVLFTEGGPAAEFTPRRKLLGPGEKTPL